MDAQQEVRVDEHALERELNAGVKTSTVLSAAGEEPEKCLEVGLRHRASIRQPRDPRKDLRGTGLLLGRGPGLTDENGATAGRLGRRPGYIVRTANLDRTHARVVHVELVVRQDPAPLEWLRNAFRLPQLPHERDADDARSRLHRHADLQACVAADLHVRFPFGIAGKAGFAVAGVTGRGGPALSFPSDGEPFQQLAIEPDIELLRPAHAHDVVLILPPETNFDEVLGVDRKDMPNRDAAARSERQILALPIVLHHVQGNLECLEARAGGRQTRRKPRDLTRHRHVSLQVGRRNREDVREVVEAAVRRLVSRQQRPHVQVEREQVANRVVVFRAIQTVDRIDPAWIRTDRPRPVDVGLQPARQREIGGGIGPRPPRWRHRARPKLRNHALPHLRVGTWLRRIEIVERKTSGTQCLVMAGDTVLIDDFAYRGRRRWDGRGRRLLAPRRGLDVRERDNDPAGDDQHGDRGAPQARELEHPPQMAP